jgi:hypothetical protein
MQAINGEWGMSGVSKGIAKYYIRYGASLILPDGTILKAFQATRARQKLEQLGVGVASFFLENTIEQASSYSEKQYIYKALAAGNEVQAIVDFARTIRGKDADWMQNNLRLTADTSGSGITQQFSHTCGPTTVQALRGEMDPIYALQMHTQNPNLSTFDRTNATANNPNMAADQRSMLTSPYTGTTFRAHSGVAANRNNGGAGRGRWVDDHLNAETPNTGISYTTKQVGVNITLISAIGEIRSAAIEGKPVPIVIGNAPKAYTHYVLVTGTSMSGGSRSFTIHDPATGRTSTRTLGNFLSSTINISNMNRLTAVEVPD